MTRGEKWRTSLFLLALLPLSIVPADAGPAGPSVAAGSATVQGAGTAAVVVNQSSQNAIINWQSFNIGTGESTRIIMPGASSTELDRVTGSTAPSQIFGSLTSNGKVFLVNPNGILFGPNAQINVGSLLATTHDIKNADFMAGRYNFNGAGNPAASVVNQGSITAQTGGFAALVAPGVRNTGTITAWLGQVGLASANSFALDFYGDRLIKLNLGDSIAASVIDLSTGQALKSLVSNEGKIKANGGRVELTAVAARAVVDSVVNNSGVIEANSIGSKNGMIVLQAATAAAKPAGAPTQTVSISGKLSAAGKGRNAKGGTIVATAENVAVKGATINASGNAGGGAVLIGGDWGGGHPDAATAANQSAYLEPFTVPIASTVSVDANTTINASALTAGNGGKVVLWSQDSTSLYGTILARGGSQSGDGGFVETSGGTVNFAQRFIDTTAPAGKIGTWLVDPTDLTIDATAATAINTALATNSVILQTTDGATTAYGGVTASGPGDIIIAAPITWSSASTLSLRANNAITIDAPITVAGAGGLALSAAGNPLAPATPLISFGLGASVQFTDTPNSGQSLTIGRQSYALLYSIGDVQAISASTTSLSGNYALALPIDASGVTSWTPIGTGAGNTNLASGTGFAGKLEGLGNTISNLTIGSVSAGNVGLFGSVSNSGIISNLNVANIAVTAAANDQNVGAFAGTNSGTLVNVFASGSVNGAAHTQIAAGGIAGGNASGGVIVGGSAVSVSVGTGLVGDWNAAGGVVGINYGQLQGASARGTVASGDASDIGGLVGSNYGTIGSSFATGAVSGGSTTPVDGSYIGGLVGVNWGGSSISSSYASGNVTGLGGASGGPAIGGFIGPNWGSISNSYATGAVSLTGNGQIGGFTGGNWSTITTSYSSGMITANAAGSLQDVGGFAGINEATVSNSYWDATTSGMDSSHGVSPRVVGNFGAQGLSTSAFGSKSAFSTWSFGPAPGSNSCISGGACWVIVDQDGTLNNANGAAGATRPMLLTEYSTTITNPHQLQLVALDPTANYTLANNIDLGPALSNSSEVWGPNGSAGFIPIGNSNAPFTGTLNGSGYTIKSLSISQLSQSVVGLFGYVGNGGFVENIGLLGGSVTGGTAGALVASNSGDISGAYSTVTVSGSYVAGGLIAENGTNGIVTSAYATGTVGSATTYSVGGLIGVNNGTVLKSYASGAVTGDLATGGLVGVNNGSIVQSFATGAVTSSGGADLTGGLVGGNGSNGSVAQSYAAGNVSGHLDVGGLIGSNSGAVSQTYASGVVSGTYSATGGLVGSNYGGVVSTSYWDMQATGQINGVGSNNGTFSATGLTTAQFQAGLPSNFDPHIWGSNPGINNSYPFLSWQLPAGTQMVAGYVYSDAGATAVGNGITVSGLINGTSQTSVTTNANGYYDFLLPSGTLTASGTQVATYTTGANAGVAYAQNVTGPIYDLNIYGGYLNITSGAPTLSAVAAGLATAAGSSSGSMQSIVSQLTGTQISNLQINSTSTNFSIDGLVNTATMVLSSTGAVTQSGSITATNLALLGNGGSYTLTNSGNQIGTLAANTGSVSIANNGDLNIGTVAGTSGVTTSGALTLNVGGAITASGPVNVDSFTLAAGNWTQVAGTQAMPTLPGFTANDFTIIGGSFLRAAGGDGSDTPYQIADIYGLQGIGSSPALLAASYALANNIDASGTVNWNGGAGFVPIGGHGGGFAGALDGNGNTINGLTSAPNDSSTNNIGLFATMAPGASVSNVVLANVSVTANSNVSAPGQFIGALAGQNAGTIENVTVASGTIDGGSAQGIIAGGLVGQNGLFGPTTGAGTVTGSMSAANVTVGDGCNNCSGGLNVAAGLVGSNSGNISGSSASGTIVAGSNATAGGLVGQNANWGANNNPIAGATISNSSASGAVSSAGVNVQLGGLVGSNNPLSVITNSQAFGPVTSTASLSANAGNCSGGCGYVSVGGFAGQNFGTISGPMWTTTPAVGSLPSCGTGYTCASGSVAVGSLGQGGGFVGLNDGIINYAFAGGNVTGAAGLTGGQQGPFGNTTNIGGFVGSNSGQITASFASGTVGTAGTAYLNAAGFVADNSGTIDSSLAAGMLVVAGDNSTVAGFVGGNAPAGGSNCGNCNNGDGDNNNASITNSQAYGNVAAGALSVAGGFAAVGGGGGNPGGTFSNVTASGAVVADHDSIVGGLVGALLTGSSISNSAAQNTAVASIGSNSLVGGIAGFSEGTISNNVSSAPVTGTSQSFIGGIVGVNFGLVSQASADPVVGASGGGNFIGGIAGLNVGSIVNSSAQVMLVSNDPTNYVGGIAGVNGTYNLSSPITISGSSFPAGRIDDLTTAIGTGFAGVMVGSYAPATVPTPPSWLSNGNCSDPMCSVLAGGTLATAPSGPSLQIAGFVYDDGAADPGIVVSGLVNGTSVGTAKTGTDGSYDIAVSPGAVSGTTWQVLTYMTSGATGGIAYQQNVTGSISNLNIYVGSVTATSSVASLSVGVAGFNTASGGNPAVAALLSQLSTLQINATGPSFLIDQPLPAYAGTLVLSSPGTVSQSASVNVASLALLGSGGSYVLTDSGNQVGTLAANAGSVNFTNQSGLAIGTVAGTSGVTTSGAFTLNAGGTITAPAPISVGTFTLAGGDWTQIAATLPGFAAADFAITGGSFLRAAGGDGSPGAPYQIADVYGLQGIGSSASLLTANYVLASNIDASGTANWNGGAGFVPIGASIGPFSGSFDGAGNTISGLTINLPSASSVGLFGTVDYGGVVKNVGLIAASVTGSDSVGSLIGYNDGTVSGAYATGMVTGDSAVGGLVGANSGAISQSYAAARVQGTGDDDVGGLVGYNGGTVSQSYATGNVTGPLDLGGLVGDNSGGTITLSYATGTVTGTNTASDFGVGGLVGYMYGGSVSQSYATGAVGAPNNVGGLVGYNGGSITQSYSSGAVSGQSNVGGLIGYDAGGTYTSAYWDTQTSGQSASAGGSAWTTTQFQAGPPPGFDVNVWSSNSAVNGGYPYLSWQSGTPVPTVVTYTVAGASSIYGGMATPGAVTLTGPSGVLSPGIVTGTLEIFSASGTQITLNANTPAGIYSEEVVGLSNTNYVIASTGNTPGTLTIAQRPITVSADAQTTTYGHATPSLTYTIGGMGLASGDALSGALATTATPTSNVGQYAITQGSLAASSNYQLTYTGANVTINPATLTYVAAPASMTSGVAVPPLSGSVTGFQNGDSQASATSGNLTFTTPASSNSSAGSYAVDGSGLTPDSNYVFAQAPSNATALTVTAPAGTPPSNSTASSNQQTTQFTQPPSFPTDSSPPPPVVNVDLSSNTGSGTGTGGTGSGGGAGSGTGGSNGGTTGSTNNNNGSLANHKQGGNGAPPGTRLIDMAVMPLPPGTGMPPPGETRFTSNEVVLQFGEGLTPAQVAALAQRFGLTVTGQQTIGSLGRTVYDFHINNGQSVRDVIAQIEAAGLNAAAQPNYSYRPTQDGGGGAAGAGDPAQYTVEKLHLAAAHRLSEGDNVVIAVIDSQIDINQPDLAGAIKEQFDAGCGAAPPDPHGTNMAGAIASHGQLLGIAPHAKIIAICAFGGAGTPEATSVKIIRGLDYAIQHGAKIVNMSFAGPHDPALAQELQIAREKGLLLIGAAGNDGPKSPPLYPGADPNVLAVTATDVKDHLFTGANQGTYVGVAAPGVNILVPAPHNGVEFTTGTSVATAHVSGVAALLLAQKPSLTPEDLRAILTGTAKRLGPKGSEKQFGAGLVDPLKALRQGAPPPQKSASAAPARPLH